MVIIRLQNLGINKLNVKRSTQADNLLDTAIKIKFIKDKIQIIFCLKRKILISSEKNL
jgi:hypothetical protein